MIAAVRPLAHGVTARLHQVVANLNEALAQRHKDPAAVALGKKGGKARAQAILAKRRKEIARKAAKSRWR
jgi:hypothetical protein